ncbi:hypothetical protein MBLNU230_g8607t1 [Neophaeotheca triangularis]
MESIKTLLVANRGEIAVRIIRTAKELGIRTVSIYATADAASLHVSQADVAVLLPGSNSTAYTDGEAIIDIAKSQKADAIIPGYGFLSENAAFAKSVQEAGLAWVGPSPDAIDAFGIKHVARELAEKAGVPIVPGTKGLVESEGDALAESEKLGYPIMLKATGGGGGMGLVTCKDADEVRAGFKTVRSRGETLFKNAGMFIEKYYPASHHIEVQVFGNGQGQAIHFGERECSIQRRHQKVIEECPSPFVQKRPELRERLGSAAVSLAESIKYASAGTVEYLVDDASGDFFFLEMNTRLQVEHPVTELCYDVDLVELMMRQADAQLSGNGGLSEGELKALQPKGGPTGVAIEARVYAEVPHRDYAPSPGLLQEVEWHELPGGSRIDTWVFTGSTISPFFDPLIAKVINHAKTRTAAIKGMDLLLTRSRICGPPTNLDFLAAIVTDERYQSGHTLTSFLNDFDFVPHAIDVISPGAQTLVQDLPGRPAVGKGIPHAGAMDPVALGIANMLVGNDRGTAGLEITLNGPELRFLGPAVIALTGAPMEATLDGDQFPMWSRKHIKRGQTLRIGKTTGGGCRSYLAVYGGFPSVADYFDSKSTSSIVGIGGYQGRALAPGDLLAIVKSIPERLSGHPSVPDNLRPQYTNNWELFAMPGPHQEGHFTSEDVEMLYNTEWKISHNASRSAIRLIGPVPQWARSDGGEGGAHPSNLVEVPYSLGALNFTGDDPCLFANDAPNFGGFVSGATVVEGNFWKMGQLRAGDTLRLKRVSLDDALGLRRKVDSYLARLQRGIEQSSFEGVAGLESISPSTSYEPAILYDKPAKGTLPRTRYRQSGDNSIMIEYGNEQFDINHKCRVRKIDDALHSYTTPAWLKNNLINTVSCGTTLMLFYNGLKVSRTDLIAHLQKLETQVGDLSQIKVPTRRYRLPLTFESKEQDEATRRYMETQRPHAPYLPSNIDYVAKNNAFTTSQLKQNLLSSPLMAMVVGFFCGNTVSLPVDPRNRMQCAKANPSRVFTPAGTLGWGGSCASIYPTDSPGGYMYLARTIPCFDYLGYRRHFSPEQPWLFNDFDLLQFYEVSEEEFKAKLALFDAGVYDFDFEETEFDMAEHNRFLEQVADEVREIRGRQRTAQAEMIEAEKASLAQWREEKARSRVDEGTVEALLGDPGIQPVSAPVDANVWKILVEAGQDVKAGQTLAVLEAMKLEINVDLPKGLKGTAKVEKILVTPGETVKAGEKIILIWDG